MPVQEFLNFSKAAGKPVKPQSKPLCPRSPWSMKVLETASYGAVLESPNLAFSRALLPRHCFSSPFGRAARELQIGVHV
jgi:hypothetical protein